MDYENKKKYIMFNSYKKKFINRVRFIEKIKTECERKFSETYNDVNCASSSLRAYDINPFCENFENKFKQIIGIDYNYAQGKLAAYKEILNMLEIDYD